MTVDELVVTLALDSSKFNQGQKDALESFRKTDEEMQKRLKGIELANKNAGYSFDNTTSAAQGLFGAILGGGLAVFARDMMTSTAAAGRAAANIGLMTNEFQAFGRTVERNGGDFDTAVGSLTSLNNQVERLKMTGEASDNFWQFAGMTHATEEELKNPLKLMEAFARYAEEHKDNIKDVNFVGQLAGIDQGSINTLLKGRTEFLKEYAEAIKGTATPEQVAAMKTMQDAWVTLEQKMGDVGRSALADIAPDFDAAASSVSKFTENNKELSVSIVEILAKLIELRVAIVALRMLGLGAIAGPVGIAAFGAYEATKRLMPGSKAKEWDDAHPWLKNIDAFFGLAGADGELASSPAPSGGGDMMAKYRAAIAAIESQGSGGYSAIGPVTSSGDRAYGKYQIMGNNIGPWSQAALGRKLTTQEFLASPEYQDAIFDKKFGEYVSKFGNSQDAASAWLTGRKLSRGANSRDVLGTSGADYVRKFNSNLGGGQGINIDSVNIEVHTDSKDPRKHGDIIADAFKLKVGQSIATQANTGLKN